MATVSADQFLRRSASEPHLHGGPCLPLRVCHDRYGFHVDPQACGKCPKRTGESAFPREVQTGFARDFYRVKIARKPVIFPSKKGLEIQRFFQGKIAWKIRGFSSPFLIISSWIRNYFRVATVVIPRLEGRGALLAVDEAHHLAPRLLDELRCLYDMSECGLALIGGDELWSSLAGDRRCARVIGRIGIRLRLGAAAEADVLDLAAGVLGRRPEKGEAKRLIASARARRRALCAAGVGLRMGRSCGPTGQAGSIRTDAGVGIGYAPR